MSGLRCCRCGRSILASAVTITRKAGGPSAYGPKCARILGLLELPTGDGRPKRAPVLRRQAAPDTDPRQLDLLAAIA